jgi:oligogalacturonide lyase
MVDARKVYLIFLKYIPQLICYETCYSVLCMRLLNMHAYAQIGKRFPSEKKVVKDPVTGVMLTFLTSTPAGDAKI